MAHVVVVGSYGVGLTVRTPAFPRAGETVLGTSLSRSHGGKGSNQAVGAARLGCQVTFITALGRDEAARSATEMWRAEGVDARVVEKDAPTMTGVIAIDDTGENRIIVVPGALAELRPIDLLPFVDVISSADLCVAGFEIPVLVAAAAIAIAENAGVPTLLNPAPASGDASVEMWARARYLTPNLTEAQRLTGVDRDDPDELLDALTAHNPHHVAITLGARGAVWAGPDGRGRTAPVAPAAVIDTTGAGDAFTAALAAALARGSGFTDALDVAARAGAWAVAHHEVLPGLPTTDQICHPPSGSTLTHDTTGTTTASNQRP